MFGGMPVEEMALAELKPHPRNYRKHPPAQLEQIAASIQAHGFYRPIVVAQDNTILAGHGLAAAAELVSVTFAPVVKLEIDPESPEALQVLAGDNELGRMAETDTQVLADILQQVKQAGQLQGTGFDEASLDNLLATLAPKDQVKYTRKVVSPIYQPTGAKPKVKDLVSREKTNELLADILEAGLPKEVEDFLRAAATRHLAFDYAQIAEYYAHATPQVQRLMEASALVIVDFDRAIEEGFTRLSDEVQELWGQDHGAS